MDISFQTEEGKFNYRVCAIMLHDGKILAMHDERSPYYYLPGGRVAMNETAENAILRELKEELDITAKISRPLWLNQGFFTEDVCQLQYHEICLYFLIDFSATDLLSKGENFTLYEGKHTHRFEWLEIGRLRQEYFYPNFLKEKIFELPEHLTINTELE
jgi:ADP-ribose pyrophosphatase YjhB (NUDIX family)